MLRLYNSFGDENIFHADLLFHVGPHLKHPADWLLAAADWFLRVEDLLAAA